nr:hypothetical protein Iba_chr01eCG8070 [Ipomoea batatas]
MAILHPSDPLKSGSFVAESCRSTPFLPKWRRKKQNGISGGGGFARPKKEKAIAAERYAGARVLLHVTATDLPPAPGLLNQKCGCRLEKDNEIPHSQEVGSKRIMERCNSQSTT